MISPTTSSSHPATLAAGQLGNARRSTSLGPTLDRAMTADSKSEEGMPLREAFDTFVGETFYGTLLKSLRQSVGKPPYFHGGRAEEVFQGQLDQTLVEEMSKASAQHLTGPMFDLFTLSRTGL